jgi:hypothetical protein
MAQVVRIEHTKPSYILIFIDSPSFGELLYVSPFEFVDIVDNAAPEVSVVIHLSDEVGIFQCRMQ